MRCKAYDPESGEKLAEASASANNSNSKAVMRNACTAKLLSEINGNRENVEFRY